MCVTRNSIIRHTSVCLSRNQQDMSQYLSNCHSNSVATECPRILTVEKLLCVPTQSFLVILRRNEEYFPPPKSHQLTKRSRVLPEKLTIPQLVKQLPVYYVTIMFVTGIQKSPSPALLLSKTNTFHSFHAKPLRSISTLAFHPSLGLPNVLSLRSPHSNTVYTSLFVHTCHMPYPSHSSLFYHPNNIWWAVQITKLRWL